ncbi:hypothetical protein PQX77_008023 [Marasmius sp. AFHP31]|nr:hypothetical protein PQX77_008023 [Marasmius sp. AFHP31]
MAPYVIDYIPDISPDTGVTISMPIPLWIGAIGAGGLFIGVVVAKRCLPTPCTVEQLIQHLKSLDQLINENSNYREDLLGEAGPAFKHSLREINCRVEALEQARREYEMSPSISLTSRAVFGCREQYRLSCCKALLRDVETNIKLTLVYKDHIRRAEKASRDYELTETRRARISHD